MTLWIEQRGLCWICGEPMLRFTPGDPLNVTRDHLLPRSRGGPNNVRNYLLAHQKCNSNRGAPQPGAKIADIKRAAIARLRLSPHWIQDYPDHGMYRGNAPPAEKWAQSMARVNATIREQRA